MRKHLHKTGSTNPYIFSATGFSDLTNHHLLSEGFEIVNGPPPNDSIAFIENLFEQLKNILTSGQEQLNSDPLPDDIQDQIWDLETLAQTRFDRGGLPSVVRLINDFEIQQNRQDVSQQQRTIVNDVKAQMLALLN